MNHPSRKCLVWLITAFLILLGANLYVFFTRGWEDSLLPSNYATINYSTDAPTLWDWTPGVGRLRLNLIWDRTPEQWQLFVDGKPTELLPGGLHPEIAMTGGSLVVVTNTPKDFHTYKLRPLPAGIGLDLDFSIEAVSAELYRKAGLTADHDIYVVHTTVPIGKFKRYSVAHWTDDYSYVGREGLAKADAIVRDGMMVKDSDDTPTRMEKVAGYLRSHGLSSDGVPRDDYRWMNPFAIYEEMSSGKGHGWCTQNAQIYVFFANRAGIPTRFVFGCNDQDDTIYYNGHSWAESWVKEKGRWAYVDMTQMIVGVSDRNGVPLNTADIYEMCQHGTFDGVTARVFKDWNWKDIPFVAKPVTAVTVPFTLVNEMAKEEYNTLAILKYRSPPNVEDVRELYSSLLKDRTFAWTNFKRYLFNPPLAYSHLQTDGVHTYCVRRSLFFAWAAVTLMLVIAAFRKRG